MFVGPGCVCGTGLCLWDQVVYMQVRDCCVYGTWLFMGPGLLVGLGLGCVCETGLCGCASLQN